MKPNFALSLSSEGIKLLHRAAGGWREVGEVSVTAEDLAGELAVLRKTAASLEPGGVRSKLIIPPSQIKYLTIDTMGLSDAARRKSAEAALRDATPYDLSDLAYDICMDGAKTHVAAVARETLAEAEAFANEHRFHPVSFVAIPDDAPYLGEPYFGVTNSAAALVDPDDFVEPDGIAVVIVGPAAPEPAPAPQPKEETQPAPAPEAKATPETQAPAPEVKANPAPEAEAAPEVKAPSAPEVKATPAPAVKAPPKPEPAAAPQQPAAVKETSPASERPAPPPAEKVADTKGTDKTVDKDPEFKRDDKPATATTEEKPTVAAPTAPAVTKPPTSEGTAPPVAAPRPPTADPAPAAGPAPAVGPAATATDAPLGEPKKPTLSAAKKVSASSAPPSAPSSTAFSSRRSPPTGAAPKSLGGAQRTETATTQPDSSSLLKPAEVADTPEPAEAKVGFLSRRKAAATAAVSRAVTTPKAATARNAPSEAERMTVFGARSEQVGGKPRFLGLIMTVVLLVFLAGVAAWAAVFLDDGLAGLLRKEDIRTTASDPENQVDPEIIRTPDGLESGSPPADDAVQIAALDPVLSAEDTAVLDAMQDPRAEAERPVITEQEAAARYAVTGIWPLSPETPLTAPQLPVEEVYQSTVDPVSAATDAIALPAPDDLDTDVQLAAIASPPSFDLRRDASAGGLLTPTTEGVVAPGGYTLIAAGPPLKPPAVVLRGTAPEAIAAVAAAPSPLLGFRPKNRPLGLAERAERNQLGGVTRVELAAFRPALRPRSIQDRAREAEEAAASAAASAAADLEARAAASAAAATAAAAAALAVPQPVVAPVAASVQNATALAIAQSRRPDTRPRNFARIVKRAERTALAPAETRVAAAATTAPRSVAPSIPSKTSVARSATVKNAINLRQVNLIGVYGKPSSRRALIRLSNGRYQKVSVGDRLDGGRVAAIGNTELRYTKNGRNVVLKMP